jgi:hypothetical protein
MDVKVSRKEARYQPGTGGVEVLMSNIFDMYPVFGDSTNENLITDIETISGDRVELLDRAMWAVVKQRGNDPLDETDGSQWAEAILGEVSVATLLTQVHAEVLEEGPGVKDTYTTSIVDGKEYLVVDVSLTCSA